MLRRLLFELRYLLGQPPWDTGETPPELYAFLQEAVPGRALDLGCGTGTNALTMSEFGWQVVGVDFSLQAIWHARRKARLRNADPTFLRQDVTRLHGIEAPFDLILDIGCFHTLPVQSQERYHDQLERLLAPNGTYLLYTWIEPDSDSDAAPPSIPALQQRLQACCKLAQVEYGTDRDGHQTSAWLTFVRKST